MFFFHPKKRRCSFNESWRISTPEKPRKKWSNLMGMSQRESVEELLMIEDVGRKQECHIHITNISHTYHIHVYIYTRFFSIYTHHHKYLYMWHTYMLFFIHNASHPSPTFDFYHAPWQEYLETSGLVKDCGSVDVRVSPGFENLTNNLQLDDFQIFQIWFC